MRALPGRFSADSQLGPHPLLWQLVPPLPTHVTLSFQACRALMAAASCNVNACFHSHLVPPCQLLLSAPAPCVRKSCPPMLLHTPCTLLIFSPTINCALIKVCATGP